MSTMILALLVAALAGVAMAIQDHSMLFSENILVSGNHTCGSSRGDCRSAVGPMYSGSVPVIWPS